MHLVVLRGMEYASFDLDSTCRLWSHSVKYVIYRFGERNVGNLPGNESYHTVPPQDARIHNIPRLRRGPDQTVGSLPLPCMGSQAEISCIVIPLYSPTFNTWVVPALEDLQMHDERWRHVVV